MALKKNYRALDHLIIALASLKNPEVEVDPAEALSEALGSDDLDDALADLDASQTETLEEQEEQEEAAVTKITELSKVQRHKLLGNFLEKASVDDDADLPAVDDPEAMAEFMEEQDPEVLAELLGEEEQEEEEEEEQEDELAQVSTEVASARGRLKKAGQTKASAKGKGQGKTELAGRVRDTVNRVSQNLANL